MKEINTPIEGVKVLQFGTTFYAVYKLDNSRWQAHAMEVSNNGWVWQNFTYRASTYDLLLMKLCDCNDILLISHAEIVVNYNHTRSTTLHNITDVDRRDTGIIFTFKSNTQEFYGFTDFVTITIHYTLTDAPVIIKGTRT